MDLIKTLTRYVKIWTTSNPNSETTPSDPKQLELLKLLKEELIELGLKDAELDQYGRVYAHLEGNKDLATIGLCAHTDTADDAPGNNVNPQVIYNYDGKDILLKGTNEYLSPKDFPDLKTLVGKTIMTTDGTTLLGADDKAGITIIMAALEEYKKLPVDKRHPVAILFTPDEEVGRGPEHFDLKKYGADFAVTIDGGPINEINAENFNAFGAKVSVVGRSVHPGSAKDQMINAARVLSHFINELPKDKVPEKTEKYQGFSHLCGFSGEVEHAEALYILRTFTNEEMLERKQDFINAKEATLNEFRGAKIDVQFQEQYHNMKEVLDEHPEVLKTVEEAYRKVGVNFIYDPCRGGTDGATFSFLGCPCPNLGTGGRNFHGRYEYVVIEEMETMVKIILELLKA